MDLDAARKANLCFNCGEAGHMRRDCKKKQRQFNARLMAMELTVDEQLALFEEITGGEHDEENAADEEETETTPLIDLDF